MPFWIVGKRPVIEAIKSKKYKILNICVLNSEQKKILEDLSSANKISIVDKKFFTKISKTNSQNQGYAANIEINIEQKEKLSSLLNFEEHVCLDGITDTNNIGSIIRNCVAFGVKSIIINKRLFSYANQTIVKSSAGAIFYIKINLVTNLSSAIKFLKQNGYFICALNNSKNSHKLNKKIPSNKKVYIFGSEGKGISNNLLKQSDIEIKLDTEKKMEHINVSNAVAAFLCLKNFIKN